MPGFLTTASGMTVCGNSTASWSGRMPMTLAGTMVGEFFCAGMSLDVGPLYNDVELGACGPSVGGDRDRQRHDEEPVDVVGDGALVFHGDREGDAPGEITRRNFLLHERAVA